MGAEGRRRWPIAVLACATVAGLLFAAAATTSGGSDLRATGGDPASLVRERTAQITQRRVEARRLQAQIDHLTAATGGSSSSTLAQELPRLRAAGGLNAVHGPGMRIELSDTPRDVEFKDVNPNLLVVHQQDIQAFVNALWAGGAEAVALQGQRLVSTSGIKCVGNTVVIDGVPYSPPYVIEAIGNPVKLHEALNGSPEVTAYRAYARDYQLGLAQADLTDIHVDPYAAPVEFNFARPLGSGS